MASVRIICAPAGCGKTVALKQYAASRASKTFYAAVPAGADGQALRNLLAGAKTAGELILDHADRADPVAYARLVEELCRDRIETRVIIAGRSRRRLRADALLACGAASAYDAVELAFDGREIFELATAYGVPFDQVDIAQALYDTEGWPIAAEWLIRDAAETRSHLRDVFNHWRERNGHLLLEYIENESQDDPAAFDSFRSLLISAPGEQRKEMERLLHAGLPMMRTRAGPRPYRILRRLASLLRGIPADRVSRSLPPVMMLNVLGQLRCEIAGKPVSFSRRRDQTVFLFVALSPERRVQRETVLRTFWPTTDHRDAAQGLRTTISRIRRAIMEAVPGVDPDLYFQTEPDLRVDSATVALDARRFAELIEQGRADDALGVSEMARRQYRLAYNMYRDDLLASEAPEPCFAPIAHRLRALYLEALSRLMQLHAAIGDLENAREYERELHAARGRHDGSQNGLLSAVSQVP